MIPRNAYPVPINQYAFYATNKINKHHRKKCKSRFYSNIMMLKQDLFLQLNNFERFSFFHTPTSGCSNHIPTSKTVMTTKNMVKRHKNFVNAQKIAKYK